jgi:diguanylate cyclase (GGDEF)-like protein/PAS domain S-box-containing protein
VTNADGSTAVLTTQTVVAERFRVLMDHVPVLVIVLDAHGRVAFANRTHEAVLGYSADDLVGTLPLDRVHPDDRHLVEHVLAPQPGGEWPDAPVEFRFKARDGAYRHLEAVTVDLSADPKVGGVMVASRDVSDRRRAEEILKDQTAILEGIARSTPLRESLDQLCRMVERWVRDAVAVIFVARDGRMRVATAPSASEALAVALDRSSPRPRVRAALADGLVAASIASTPPDPEVAAVCSAEGLEGWWAAPIFPSTGAEVLGSMTVLLPSVRTPEPMEEQVLVTASSLAAIAIERARAERRLAFQARHDALTGLANRERLIERLRSIRGGDGKGQAAVLFLDLDRFKVLNDSAGHDVGDRVLVEMAQRLRAALRDGDLVARFGGDEFVVVCDRLEGTAEVMAVAERLLDVVSQPVVIDGMELVVTASVGVALVDGRTPEVLLRDADAAMYRAKERGRARVEIFDDGLRAQVVARLETERDLRRGLDLGQFVVHYQPVMGLQAGRLAGFEALLRWDHPTRGLLTPEHFLDVAEETGLVARIGAYAREEALSQWTRWCRDHPEWGDFLMGVNLAAAELRDASLGAQVKSIVDRTGVDPGHIVFEVSERVLAADTDTARAVLGELRRLGVMLALDDFGTGSSPLLHLRRLPIHAVKLDKALVGGLGVDRDDHVVVSAVTGLAHRLGLFVVAEGVENVEQLRLLVADRCLLAQGHVFAPAMPATEVEDWVGAQVPDWAVLDLSRRP